LRKRVRKGVFKGDSLLKKGLKIGGKLVRAMVENVAIGIGDSARDGGDIQRACLLYSTAIQANPDCLYAYFRRGEAYQRLGKFIEAKQDLETVIEKTEPIPEPFPKNASQEERDRLIQNAEAQLLLANLYASSLHQPVKALLQYTLALERNYQIMPFFDDTIRDRITRMHYKRAELLEGEGRYQEAIGDLTDGILLVKAIEDWNNGIEEGMLCRMRAFIVLGRNPEAQEDLREVLKHNPYWFGMMKAGYALYDVDPVTAWHCFEEALENLEGNDPKSNEMRERCTRKIWDLNLSIATGKNN